MKVTQECSASPAAVWAVLTDLSRFADVADIVALQRLDDGTEFGVGTRWRETRRMFGKDATEEMWVTDITPGVSYTVAAESRGTAYRSVLTVVATDSGSLLTLEFDGTGTNVITRALGATVGKLFEGATRSALQSDLVAVASAAESDEGATPAPESD
jgi:hypothetical protein